MKRAYVLISVSAMMLATTSCGDSKPAPSTVVTTEAASKEARLTSAQALTLSRMLVKDQAAGGAMVSATIPFGSAAEFVLSGPVDWTSQQASYTLITKRSDGVATPDQSLYWDRGAALVQRDGLTEAMAAKGRTGVKFLLRALSPKTVAIDQVIAFAGSLANDRAENPILLRQADTGFVGAREIDGVAVEGYRYGKTTYWVDPKAGVVRQVVAKFARYEKPVVFRLSKHGPQSVTLPPSEQVVDATTIPDVLAATEPKVGTSVG